MDKRLEKALDYSNFRLILATRQENLKQLMNNKCMLSYEGGLFKINKELISFVHMLITYESKEFIFVDVNDIPIKITNLIDFKEKLLDQYMRVLDQYYQSYQKLSEARGIRKVIDWNEEEDS